ncbi:MAG: UDP-N-acetylmuramate dehydrogenase [Elusimicrobia bacterium]|nr:UDP-N-acetylmuramate dehydrogenase [Elusimicrobiota bacterium]
MSDWRKKIKDALPAAKLDEPLARYTTFRIGGPADCFVELKDAKELATLMRLAKDLKQPVLFIGFGSNLLVRDGGVRGIVARLRGEFEGIEFLDGERVRAGAAVRVPQFVTACAEMGLCGDEPLVGIPGTIGGALVMNAGTREGEIGPLVVEVEAFDPESLSATKIMAKELEFQYRRSNLEGRVVLGCVLQLKRGDKVDIMKRVQEYQQKRLQTQPIHTYNVGSTFKNPPGKFVAQLIEKAGLKGKSVGGARVSPLHANFIENFAKASASDVLELVSLVQKTVKNSLGLDLELEMKVVGEP